MENTKVDLINSIVELNDALQILIVLAADNKDPDYLKYENKAADILKQQYGAFSLYFNEIRHTRDIEELYRVMGDYLSHLERNSSDSNMLLYCLPWINVYGHNGYITEKPPFVDEWESSEQTAEIEQPPEHQRPMPDVLATDEAKRYFEKAIDLGLMDADYNWLKGLQMLACFAREMSMKLQLGKGVNGDGQPRISWQPFETLFNLERYKLRSNYNDIQKTGQSPKEIGLIDKVFE